MLRPGSGPPGCGPVCTGAAPRRARTEAGEQTGRGSQSRRVSWADVADARDEAQESVVGES
eukprot:5072504-Alexandrium_andersonii.AAC.1